MDRDRPVRAGAEPVEQPVPNTRRVKPRRVPAPIVPRRRDSLSGPSITGAPSSTTSIDLAQWGAGAAVCAVTTSAAAGCDQPSAAAATNTNASPLMASMIGARALDGSIFVVGAASFAPQTVPFGKLAEVIAGKACRSRGAADVVAVFVEHGLEVLCLERIDDFLFGVLERSEEHTSELQSH